MGGVGGDEDRLLFDEDEVDAVGEAGLDAAYGCRCLRLCACLWWMGGHVGGWVGGTGCIINYWTRTSQKLMFPLFFQSPTSKKSNGWPHCRTYKLEKMPKKCAGVDANPRPSCHELMLRPRCYLTVLIFGGPFQGGGKK